MKKLPRAITAGWIIGILGIVLILCDIFWLKTDKALWISVGCSLIASALVILIENYFVVQKNEIDEWKLDKIYKARSEKSKDSDPKLTSTCKNLDIIAFGLKSFRDYHKKEMLQCLKNGTNVRILTMNPESEFVTQREYEENETPGQIKKTINDLIAWSRDINNQAKKAQKQAGQIFIKGYSCMTLDFYWRSDNELYIGPYLYQKGSQQTITMRFLQGGNGFEYYTNYFEDLWKCDEFVDLLP
jgi:hypothetical protein